MKTFLIGLLAVGLMVSLHGETPVVATTASSAQYTPEQLSSLAAPIALYPDALVALILPAATAPSDIVLAARYLQAGGDPAQIPNQPWDDNVKALANYPQVIEWMSDNLEWTSALGRAFIEQPAALMTAIQQLRAIAHANGSLVNTPQQQVVVDSGVITILPDNPTEIYIPEYDPAVVFVPTPVTYVTSVIVFSKPQHVGPWLRNQCDWDDDNVWVGQWHPGSPNSRDWRQPQTTATIGRFWQPDSVHQRETIRQLSRPVFVPPSPTLINHAPQIANNRSGTPNAPTGRGARGWRLDENGRYVPSSTPAVAGGSVSNVPSLSPQPLHVGTLQQPPALTPQPINNLPTLSPPQLHPGTINPPRINNGRPLPQIRPPQLHPGTLPQPPNITPQPLPNPPNLSPRPFGQLPTISPQPLNSPPKINVGPAVSTSTGGGNGQGANPQNFINRGQPVNRNAYTPPVQRPEVRPPPPSAPAPQVNTGGNIAPGTLH